MFGYASQIKTSLLTAMMFFLISGNAFSQVQVVDAGADNSSQSSNQAGSQTNTASSNNNGNEIVITLYNMVEALQREVQTLRGLVEEQGFQIRRMENEQRDRYLDVDNRLSELNQRVSIGSNPAFGNPSSPAFGLPEDIEPTALESAAQTALNTGLNNTVSPDTSSVGEETINMPAGNSSIALNDAVQIEPKSEEELYQEARNLLLNDGEFEDSISVFQQMIEDYPQGRLAPNAYYWQGEALILVERYSQAINVFNQVVDNFPAHEKAPDSMLKLGIVYSLMENERRAQQVWRELLEDFADSGSASLRLAELYLREGYNR
jgi:tol-pal system protein YbgF